MAGSFNIMAMDHSYFSIVQPMRPNSQNFYKPNCSAPRSCRLRIGIHMGDVLLQRGNVFGDVVNIAARIQSLAPAGGIFISEVVFMNITNKKGLDAVFVKEQILKNVKEPMKIYEILTEFRKPAPPAPAPAQPVSKPLAENGVAVLPFANMSSDIEQEYFSDGLTDDIISQLSKINL